MKLEDLVWKKYKIKTNENIGWIKRFYKLCEDKGLILSRNMDSFLDSKFLFLDGGYLEGSCCDVGWDSYKTINFEDIDEFNPSYKRSILTDEKGENMYFKKENLKPMMVIKMRDGSISLVHEYKGEFVFTDINGNDYSMSSGYENKDGLLKDDETPEFEPIEIYEPKYAHSLSVLLGEKSLEYYNLIWKESQSVEVTMQEIADKFGVPVENLKIKK